MGRSAIEWVPVTSVNSINSRIVCHLAADCGFDLAGVTAPFPVPDFGRFRNWVDRGLAGEMRYLTDHRAAVRNKPEHLLPGVQSIICVGLVYNGPEPNSTRFDSAERSWISRYAWGGDYHDIVRAKLERLKARLLEIEQFESRICIDTAPLLERSLAHRAGLGWIGKNTCLINQKLGSWFFLGELLTTLDLEPADTTPADRCGTCTRCIDACPTAAIVPSPSGGYELDARLCISYFTIELRGAIPEEQRAAMGAHVFGCDICQDVCPWNRRAAETNEPDFRPREFAPELERLAAITETEFRDMFRDSPVSRAKYRGFLRNVAVAMGNAGLEKFREPLAKLAALEDPLVAEHAKWALGRLNG
jgi:epoxyqueuosine reductase